MILCKSGFVVAEIIDKVNFTYKAWPLFDVANDKIALAITDEAYNCWFDKFEMQHIVPDLNYIKRYLAYCKVIKLNVEVLLFETLYNQFEIDNSYIVSEILGFDCIGTVYESFLRTEFEYFKNDLESNDIRLNQYGLFNTLEDTVFFSELRKKSIESGENIEDFWEELPVRISTVKLL